MQSHRIRTICSAITLLACAQAYAEAGDQAIWLRALPGESVEYKRSLAELAEPIWVIASEQTTLARKIRDICGELPAELQAEFTRRAAEDNGLVTLEQPIAEGISVAIPFCTRLDGPTTVSLERDETLSDLLQKYTGVFGQQSVRDQIARSFDVPEDQLDEEAVEARTKTLGEGQKFHLEYTAPQRLLITKSESDVEKIKQLLIDEPAEGFSKSVSATRWRAAEIYTDETGDHSVRLNEANLFPDTETTHPTLDARTVQLVEPVTTDANGSFPCGGTEDWTFFDHSNFLQRFEIEKQVFETKRGPLEPAIVGIVDSGLLGFGAHPFLERHFSPHEAETGFGTNTDVDDDQNGFVDDVWGINFVSEDGAVEPFTNLANVKMHGTQITSIVLGGEHLAQRIAGAEQISQLVVVNFSAPTGNGMQRAVELNRAVRYLADRNADIVNMSLATTTRLPYTDLHPNVLFVVAAGNKGRSLSSLRNHPAVLGGSLGIENFVTFGSVDRTNRRARFSNYGMPIDLFAPGCGVPAWDGTGFSEDHGTSLSSAFGAFVASAVKNLAGALMTPLKIKERLQLAGDYVEEIETNDALEIQSGVIMNPVKTISLTHTVLQTRDRYRFVNDIEAGRELGKYCASDEIRPELENIRKFTPNITRPGRLGLWVRYVIRNPNQATRLCSQVANPPDLDFGGEHIPLENVRDLVLQEY